MVPACQPEYGRRTHQGSVEPSSYGWGIPHRGKAAEEWIFFAPSGVQANFSREISNSNRDPVPGTLCA